MTVGLATISGPRLRPDLTIIEQVFRGETSFVVKDPATQKYFRFRPVEVGVMRHFDGHHTADEIAATLAEQGVRLTARAVDGFARKLASIGLLERTLAERTTLEIERIRAERRKRRQRQLFRGEILRMRWSFGDPDALFNRMSPALQWMFTRSFVIVSVILFALYFLITAAEWSRFAGDTGRLFGLSNLTFGAVMLWWVTMVTVFLIHELGHVFACKHFGGEVREMGFMLIYFQPAFYANVNDAWSFPELRSRLWVTAAGGWIELFVTSIAAVVWYVAQPGTFVSDVCVAVMLIGGGLALLTNVNPLIPLDGYFALTDWLAIPNLRIRAREYFAWWIRRNLLRIELPEPNATDHERRVFLIYGACSAAYIALLFLFLGMWALGRAGQAFGAIGTLIVLGLVFALARKGLVEWGRSLITAVRARRAVMGKRPGRVVGIGVAAIIVILALVPWTLTTSGKFVVAPTLTLDVTASDSAVIEAVFVGEGMRVDAGAPLVRLIDRRLESQLLGASRTTESLTVAVSRARATSDAGATTRLEAQRAEASARLSAIQARFDALTLRSRWAGVVTTLRVNEMVGRRVFAGDRILRVEKLDSLEARVALGRAGAASVNAGQVAHLIAYGDAARPIDAVVANVASGATRAGEGTVEVRVPVSRDTGWRAGATGEASIELRRSTALGAIWWGVRQLVRNDLLI